MRTTRETRTVDAPECVACGASVRTDDDACWRCRSYPHAVRSADAEFGPEPLDWTDREITRPCSCHGCHQRFRVGTRGEPGDYARVFQTESGNYRRFHEACWPW